MAEPGAIDLEKIFKSVGVTPSQKEKEPLGPNQSKRVEMAWDSLAEMKRDAEAYLPAGASVYVSGGVGQGEMGIDSSKFSDEPLTEEEQQQYEAMEAKRLARLEAANQQKA